MRYQIEIRKTPPVKVNGAPFREVFIKAPGPYITEIRFPIKGA